MKWISVKDRLPDKKDGVLIYADGVITCATISIKADGSLWPRGHGFGGYEWEYDFEYEDVTHWMELPEAPK